MDLAPRTPLRILVVDGCPEFRATVCLLIKLWEHEVHGVADADAALDVARAFRPNVVFIDFADPSLDGCGLVRRLRQLPDLAAMKAVALTASGDRQSARYAAEAGFLGALSKPIALDRFERLLAALAARPLP